MIKPIDGPQVIFFQNETTRALYSFKTKTQIANSLPQVKPKSLEKKLQNIVILYLLYIIFLNRLSKRKKPKR